ncbi:hypothetical protein BRAO375_560007 [Bradyrhizobium sp. ORS 375]|nr:hypothetical protein BRAO375_560007 [Bradyrhizobium sp. ORS 375]
MPGLVPPARPKPLWRGEGPGIHVVLSLPDDVHGRDKPGHDDVERDRAQCRDRHTRWPSPQAGRGPPRARQQTARWRAALTVP